MSANHGPSSVMHKRLWRGRNSLMGRRKGFNLHFLVPHSHQTAPSCKLGSWRIQGGHFTSNQPWKDKGKARANQREDFPWVRKGPGGPHGSGMNLCQGCVLRLFPSCEMHIIVAFPSSGSLQERVVDKGSQQHRQHSPSQRLRFQSVPTHGIRSDFGPLSAPSNRHNSS